MRSLVALAALCSVVEAQPANRATPAAEARATPAKPRKPGAELRMAGILVGATGVVGLGTSALFALSASHRADDISNAPVWNQARYDGGEMADRNAKIMFGVGTAMVAGGVVMYILGRQRANEAAQLSVTPTRAGAALVWSCDL